MKNIFVDINILQTLPPSNVNRDDTGSPKTAIFGGTKRSRVSSQSWKHSVRIEFKELFDSELLGSRTKKVGEMIATEIRKLNPEISEEKALKDAIEASNLAGLSMSKKKGKESSSEALVFLSVAQAKALAELITNNEKDSKLYKEALKNSPSVDMALFGRMVASDPSLNYDAAVQVAHSISTHTLNNEYDYFTAVDDCSEEDNAGAGHLGTVEFNSSTLYRYATINVSELVKNLDVKVTPNVVKNFVKAFALSMPTGKQNTFANRTFPDLIYVTIRDDQPVNLCGAFEIPVTSHNQGYRNISAKKLAEYAEQVYNNYASAPKFELASGIVDFDIAEKKPFGELLDELEKAISSDLSATEV